MLFANRRYSSGSRWAVWRWTDVVLRGELYLRRLHLVQTPWFAVMLHWIFRADPQPDMHDHPVSFLSVVLRGGYVEERPRGAQWRNRVEWWNWIGCNSQHRIVWLKRTPTITLCFAGPKRRDWGFHTPKGWVPWREYGKEKSPEASLSPAVRAESLPPVGVKTAGGGLKALGES